METLKHLVCAAGWVARLSQLAFPSRNNPDFPWEKFQWDNTLKTKKTKAKNASFMCAKTVVYLCHGYFFCRWPSVSLCNDECQSSWLATAETLPWRFSQIQQKWERDIFQYLPNLSRAVHERMKVFILLALQYKCLHKRDSKREVGPYPTLYNARFIWCTCKSLI